VTEPPEDPWVPIKLAAEYSKRPWRTLQTWTKRGHLDRRVIAGALHVPLYAAMRIAKERGVSD
jgi:hypothetical protein